MGNYTKIVGELLTKPLSQHSDLEHVPVRDMEAHVHRSIEIRHKELGLGKPKKPSNHFILYLAANQARAKAWRDAHITHFPHLSHPVLVTSSIVARSWRLEPPSVKSKYQALALIDKRIHAKAFPHYNYQHKRKQDRSRPLLSTTNAKQTTTKTAVVPQPLPFYNLFSPSSTQQKELSPHLFQRMASLSSQAKELEAFLTLCQKSEIMRTAYWPTDKGLDYELACLEYNRFVASTYDKLRNHVRNIQVLEPYVPKVFNLQWSYDEILGMYKVSLPTYTWLSRELTMPANVSVPMLIPMEIDQQMPLGGFENDFSADMGAVPSMTTDHSLASFEPMSMEINQQVPLGGFENDVFADLGAVPFIDTNHPLLGFEDSLAYFADLSDADIERALQEFEVAGANTTASEPVEQVPLPDFTRTEGLIDPGLFMDEQHAEAVDQDMNLSFTDMMDMIMDESEMPLKDI